MKNLFAILTVMLFSVLSISAQDAFKELKNAEKAIKKYVANTDSGDELTKGIQLMESAFSSDDVMSQAKSWITKGKLMNMLADAEMKNKTLDIAGTYVIAAPDAATDAYQAFSKAAEMSDRKNELKEIHSGLASVENHLNNFGIVAYQAKDYEKAFANFSQSIAVAETLKGMGKKSRLDDEALLSDQNFFSAVSAYYSKNFEGAMPFLKTLLDSGNKDPFVYEALYNITADSDPEMAVGYLAKGRELNPDNTGLLFTEINHYLKVGELDKLIGKLETAIEKEPDNTSIYNTLGSVYDQMQQKETDATKSQELRDKAKGYYETVLEKEPGNFDAMYSLGALYYNKAATFVDKLNTLSADLTPAGMKAYDNTKADMDALFAKALPYFEKAEKANGEDPNTIIALKEIYARLNNLEKSNEYKAKYEKIATKQ